MLDASEVTDSQSPATPMRCAALKRKSPPVHRFIGKPAPQSCNFVLRICAAKCPDATAAARSTAATSSAVTSRSASVPSRCSCGTLYLEAKGPLLSTVQTSVLEPFSGWYFAALLPRNARLAHSG